MAYSEPERRAAVELLDASTRLPNRYPANKIAEAARAYAMAVIIGEPYHEVARRDATFMRAFDVR